MKKIYIKPETEIVALPLQQQLLGGSLDVGEEYNGEQTLSRDCDFFDETAQDGSIWDEEE